MRILVCGGRDYADYNTMSKILDSFIYDGDHTDYSKITIISGMAKGADTLAVMFAKAMGCQLLEFPADWSSYGKAAGPIRNQQMLDEGKPNLVVAFPTKSSRGTYDMIRRSRKAGIKTEVVNA